MVGSILRRVRLSVSRVEALLSSLRQWISSLEDLPRSALLLGVIGAGSVALTLIFFLMNSGLTVFPFLTFVLTSVYGWYRYQPLAAKSLTFLATVSTVLTLGLITGFLFLRALNIYELVGFDILTRTQQPLWRPSEDVFSLVPMMVGTAITTLIAFVIAAPFGVMGALFISEIASNRVRNFVKPAIEILAGIPSIVYGFIGFVILNGYMKDEFSLTATGSLFAAGLMIGVMALPTVVSVADDALSSVPDSMKDGSVAMGATDWQTIKSISIPAAFSGISAAIILGVGRAIGETMAATVILGNVIELPTPIFDVFDNTITLTSLIASFYGSSGTKGLNALFAAGVVLFVTVTALSVFSQMIERRMKRKLQGET